MGKRIFEHGEHGGLSAVIRRDRSRLSWLVPKVGDEAERLISIGYDTSPVKV
jgi:hypothetical protein